MMTFIIVNITPVSYGAVHPPNLHCFRVTLNFFRESQSRQGDNRCGVTVRRDDVLYMFSEVRGINDYDKYAGLL